MPDSIVLCVADKKSLPACLLTTPPGGHGQTTVRESRRGSTAVVNVQASPPFWRPRKIRLFNHPPLSGGNGSK
jgi:hypothetical protein